MCIEYENNMASYPRNWQNELTGGIQKLAEKLEDAREYVGKNPKVQEEYKNALEAANNARTAIGGFVGTFNAEYPSLTE